MKTISIFTPVYNEEANVERCYEEIRRTLAPYEGRYDYEHVFADNASTDRTMEILRGLAARDPRVKVLQWSRNFGAESSSFAAIQHTRGDAVIGTVADLQEPPSLIPKFIELWEQGYEIVYGIYRNPHEGFVSRRLRAMYYWLIDKLSPEPLPRDFMGYSLVDRRAVDEIIKVDDFAPYIRGLIATVGFRQIGVPYERAPRTAGRSKHGFSFLLDYGINGIISHSIVPIRLATLVGAGFSLLAFTLAVAYVVLKLIDWKFQAPGATTTIFFVLLFSGVQLLFLGILGEYIGAIHQQVRRKPFVILREKINFDERPADERARTS